MQTGDITYTLPQERIAKHPPKHRGDAKLLVLHKDTGTIEHKRYQDLGEYVHTEDVIIRNNTKVIPARLITKNPRGGSVELLCIEHHSLTKNPSTEFEAIYGGNILDGDELQLEEISLRVKNLTHKGTVIIVSPISSDELLKTFGHTPIPPYMKREDTPQDKKRYQTEFAEIDGSVAAPTASLNFTHTLEKTLLSKGVHIEELTLHVGRGTFLPVKTKTIEEHTMHKEFYAISQSTIQSIQTAKQNHCKVVALGTTVTRALEHTASAILDTDSNSTTAAIEAEADIFIYPGYAFEIVDMLLTNFHAPNSTILLLAAAFAGAENLLNAYHEALKSDYMFLSYGDSMLIV